MQLRSGESYPPLYRSKRLQDGPSTEDLIYTLIEAGEITGKTLQGYKFEVTMTETLSKIPAIFTKVKQYEKKQRTRIQKPKTAKLRLK
jgi:hypothetical protein